VAPTVWAWRANRLPKIREAVTELLTTFPFERALFERAGISVTDIGHPLAQQLSTPVNQASAREFLQLGHAAPVIALLPGSRMSELEFHAQLFVEAAGLLKRYFRDAVFLVPLINSQTRAVFESAVRRSGRHSNIRILHGQAHEALAAADAALVASGTATLEAALLKCPMVVTYRLSAFTAWIVRRRKTSQYVALPNIILDRAVVPEMIQEDATPEILAAKMAEVITNPALRSSMLDAFAEVQRVLHQDSEARILAGVERALSHGR
jgi:lipid-A-disaccharide synthase